MMDFAQWIVNGLGALVVAIIGFVVRDYTGRVEGLELTRREHGERISKVESDADTTKIWMARIESKLDRLLERSH